MKGDGSTPLYNNGVLFGFLFMDSIPYFYSSVDDKGFTHSIDMIHLLGYGYYPDLVSFCNSHNLDYQSGSTNKRGKYASIFEYFNFDSVGLNKCLFISKSNRIDTYNDEAEKWEFKYPHSINTAEYWDLRFNPNKICFKSWFYDFVDLIREWENNNKGCLFLHKFDYAVDVPDVKPYQVLVFSQKKTGRFDTSFYFGRSGKHGYLKVYDKTSELHLPFQVTRFEYTFNPFNDYNFDKCFILNNLPDLKARDNAVLDMFIRLRELGYYDYDLSSALPRSSLHDIKQRLSDKMDYVSFDNLQSLLLNYCDFFHCSLSRCDEISIPIDDFVDMFNN